MDCDPTRAPLAAWVLPKGWHVPKLTLALALQPTHLQALARQLLTASNPMKQSSASTDELIVLDPKMLAIVRELEQIATTSLPVMLLGESGSGKELLANLVHRASGRHAGELVKLNCAGLTDSLVESELFGHERGAFTGAMQTHCGVFERADRGTLFLDEVAELSARTQAKLLRVLESGEIMRVGSDRTRRVDVRIVAATHRDLAHMVEQGLFRHDLFFRLKGITTAIPPLRDRTAEIVPLATLFLKRCAAAWGRSLQGFDPAATELLQRYEWPGNIRELRHVIERAVATSAPGMLQAGALSELRTRVVAASPARASRTEQLGAAAAGDLRQERHAFERSKIIAALDATGGNQTLAAKLLGVSRRTLTTKLTLHALRRPREPSFAIDQLRPAIRENPLSE